MQGRLLQWSSLLNMNKTKKKWEFGRSEVLKFIRSVARMRVSFKNERVEYVSGSTAIHWIVEYKNYIQFPLINCVSLLAVPLGY